MIKTLPIIILLILSIDSSAIDLKHNINDAYTQRVDIIELNHHYDGRGRLIFHQLIFYKWQNYLNKYDCSNTLAIGSMFGPTNLFCEGILNSYSSDFCVIDYRLLESKKVEDLRIYLSGKMTWFNYGSESYIRKIISYAPVKETWTQVDPEVKNREKVRPIHRRGLYVDKKAPVFTENEYEYYEEN